MKWLLLGILGLCFLAGIWQIKSSETSNTLQATIPAVAGVNSDLQEENRKLKEHIATLNSEIAQLKRASTNNNALQSAITETPKKSDKSTLSEEARIQAQIQEFNDALSNGNDPSVSIKNNFANEPVDSAWANPHQQQLENFFKSSFDNVFPQYIECRSTRCKITLPVSDQKNFNELSQALIIGISTNDKGIAKKIVIEPITNDGTLNFYLAKNSEVSFLQ